MSLMARPVYCLLGLPFDAVDLDEARERVVAGVRQGNRGVLSTPNVNWVISARKRAEFRDSVLASACSTADGMPLVWLAKALGIPLKGRVSGADLFVHLQSSAIPLRVFFFGGQGDVGARACARLRDAGSSLEPVGALNPGGGDIASMSTVEIIDTINAASPDLIVVSLGAVKGQGWIMHNRGRLDAAWLTHLGAVVNFVAGDVKRSPHLLGRIGLEWLWRIVQEPALWRRYGADGLALLWLVCTRVLPLLAGRAWALGHGFDRRAGAARMSAEWRSGTLELSGAWRSGADSARQWAAIELPSSANDLIIDCLALETIGAGLIGQWMALRGELQASGRKLVLQNVSAALRRQLHLNCAEYLLEP
jgi:N-acetylglucosaminyldiphosphoundecaprenol N-acetyl-beta-D-mannosaminyltransferase